MHGFHLYYSVYISIFRKGPLISVLEISISRKFGWPPKLKHEVHKQVRSYSEALAEERKPFDYLPTGGHSFYIICLLRCCFSGTSLWHSHGFVKGPLLIIFHKIDTQVRSCYAKLMCVLFLTSCSKSLINNVYI